LRHGLRLLLNAGNFDSAAFSETNSQEKRNHQWLISMLKP
jgi:hypothetical protein